MPRKDFRVPLAPCRHSNVSALCRASILLLAAAFAPAGLAAHVTLDSYEPRVYDPSIGRFLQTDPVGYKDDNNLYAYVGNDPVNRTDPQGLAGCDKSVGDKCPDLMARQEQALTKLKEKRQDLAQLRKESAAVAKGTATGLSEKAAKTAADLKKNFKASGPATIDKVDGMLGKAQAVLEDKGEKYNYVMRESETRKDENGAPLFTMASTSMGSSKIGIYPEFFSIAGLKDQLATLIHEPTHIFGTNQDPFLPEAYESAAYGLDYEDALNNAESYSNFVIR